MRKVDFFKKFLEEELGATAVEYGLIIAMIFLAMVAALQGVANESTDTWSQVESASVEAMNR